MVWALPVTVYLPPSQKSHLPCLQPLFQIQLPQCLRKASLCSCYHPVQNSSWLPLAFGVNAISLPCSHVSIAFTFSNSSPLWLHFLIWSLCSRQTRESVYSKYSLCSLPLWFRSWHPFHLSSAPFLIPNTCSYSAWCSWPISGGISSMA